MSLDVVDLRNFYAQQLGTVARRFVSRGIRARWSDTRAQRIAGNPMEPKSCVALYDAASDRAIRWNDPDIGIEWPISSPILSPKDEAAPRLKDAVVLPRF